jgi:hypothetical protein
MKISNPIYSYVRWKDGAYHVILVAENGVFTYTGSERPGDNHFIF